jgi:arabinogalactan endo-1,4-beta-galactosidase
MKLKLNKLFVLILAIGMLVLPSCNDNVTPAPPILPIAVSFAKGADVSWLPQMEANGRKFYDADGTEKDCLQLLKDRGMDAIRLRVFVNPSSDPGNGHCSKDETVAMALRVKNMGMRLMIDFHYSDSWADPGNQTKPAAWASLNFEDLNLLCLLIPRMF